MPWRPALVGPICGPPLGGFITTYASWHWIFLINVPIGLVGMALASRFIPNIRIERPDPFDFVGFLLSGCAIGGLAFGLSAWDWIFCPRVPWRRCCAAARFPRPLAWCIPRARRPRFSVLICCAV